MLFVEGVEHQQKQWWEVRKKPPSLQVWSAQIQDPPTHISPDRDESTRVLLSEQYSLAWENGNATEMDAAF